MIFNLSMVHQGDAEELFENDVEKGIFIFTTVLLPDVSVRCSSSGCEETMMMR